MISEDFLHYVWQFGLFNRTHLSTINSRDVLQILVVGVPNKDAGPDFYHAKIKTSHEIWAGNIEIHVRSSDWQKHKHHLDAAYDNVVLHVVYEYDKPTLRSDGTIVPVLELKNRIFPHVIEKSNYLLQKKSTWIPCEQQIGSINKISIDGWLSRLLVERLEHKLANINECLTEQKGSWDDTFYIFLARNFGFKINGLPFEMLAKSLSQVLLAKHKQTPLQIEALIFGQAGFLEGTFKDEYHHLLQQEYQFLQQKYELKPLNISIWKFMRTRPQNFPTIRLAQFATLVNQSNHLFSKIISTENVQEIRKLFTKIKSTHYWQNHYRFDSDTPTFSNKTLGKNAIDNILINTIALFLFAYGKHMGSEIYMDRAIELLENIPAEKNAIITQFNALGIKYHSAFYSQALLQLKNNYCDPKKCLTCGIGSIIIQKK